MDGIDNDSGNGLLWSPWGSVYFLSNSFSCSAYRPVSTRSVRGLGIDLSKGNSIYSGSTVQPAASQVLIIIKT